LLLLKQECWFPGSESPQDFLLLAQMPALGYELEVTAEQWGKQHQLYEV
jgi:hypothetical protein